MPPVAKIPPGFNTITPSLIVDDAAQAIELYTKAFGAKEEYRMVIPETGKIMHACLTIGTSKLFMTDANPLANCMATTSNFYLYFDDVDAMMAQAKQAGLMEVMAAQDMFWGDRWGCVKDRFGNSWGLATHIRDVSPAEMEEGRKEMMSKSAA